jgi:uncharacterized protein
MGWFKEIWHEIGPGEHRSVTLLREQVACIAESLPVIAAAMCGDTDASEAHERVVELEHRGDTARRAFVRELASAVAPPLDREDLFRVSRSVDDVLDNLRDFAREVELLAVTDDDLFAETLSAVEVAVTRLGQAIDRIVEAPDQLGDSVLEANKASNAIRRRYQEAVAALLVGTVDVTMLKRRQLLRRLDVVGLRLGEAADALADGAVKRHH